MLYTKPLPFLPCNHWRSDSVIDMADKNMVETYALVAKVISQKGICSAGHKVGDEFVMGELTPVGLCSWAFYTLFPFASTLQYNGSFPWESDPEKTTVACPDPENPVVFQLQRVPITR